MGLCTGLRENVFYKGAPSCRGLSMQNCVLSSVQFFRGKVNGD